MRLFGYIEIFADDISDDERTIWNHAHWGRVGPQCKAHAHWGRGGHAFTAHHCCIVMVLPEEDVVLVPQGLPVVVPPEGRGCLIFTVPDDEGPVPTW
jgi:hypothetical protein